MHKHTRNPNNWVISENYMRWFVELDYLEKHLVSKYKDKDVYYNLTPTFATPRIVISTNP